MPFDSALKSSQAATKETSDTRRPVALERATINLVLSENSIEPESSHLALIEVEQTTEPFASADGATAVIRRRHQRRAEESIADALVVAFQIVVPDILGDNESEMTLAERDDAAQALSPNGADEALSEGVEIRAAG